MKRIVVFALILNAALLGIIAQQFIALAGDDIFYQREDRLCSGLRDGVVVDFRGWDDEARYNEALSALVQAFTAPRDSAPF